MQSLWKKCPHLAILLTLSSGLYTSKQIAQELFSCPEMLWFSPTTTNSVYDFNLESSRPVITWPGCSVGRGIIVSIVDRDKAAGVVELRSTLALPSFLATIILIKRAQHDNKSSNSSRNVGINIGDFQNLFNLDSPVNINKLSQMKVREHLKKLIRFYD
ncbi:hypothetical protein Fot_50488 [Forsythia ovata]|uniref:Uncharacterized protein n=1 Tax=Forsythia ovata TaxID=205694 RepID=A0ABD1PYA7_9LAMI